MGFRMRKSFKVAPGVRINVSKSGVGASVGTRGARYTVHPSGRTTTRVGIPGTGVGWTSTASGRTRPTGARRASDRRPPPPLPAPPPKPGWFAPSGEKALYKLINSGGYGGADAEKIARDHPDHWLPAATMAGLRYVADGDTSDATLDLLRKVFESERPPEEDHFFVKYFGAIPAAMIGVAPGVMAELPFSRDLVGLALAEASAILSSVRFDFEAAAGDQPRNHPPSPGCSLLTAHRYRSNYSTSSAGTQCSIRTTGATRHPFPDVEDVATSLTND